MIDQTKRHFCDPCIHCGLTLDEIEPGACTGTKPSVPIAYASLGVRWDGVEHFRIRYSDGTVADLHQHVSFHGPYYHFGAKDQLTQPPRYDRTLVNATVTS